MRGMGSDGRTGMGINRAARVGRMGIYGPARVGGMCVNGGSGVRGVRRLARTCVVFGLDDVDGASGILKAVAQRPRPTSSDLAEWVTRRTRLPQASTAV